MNNLVVQLLLRTGTFSTDLKTARGQVQSFQKGCQNAGDAVSAFSNALGVNLGAIAKFAPYAAAAAAAGKVLRDSFKSNTDAMDAFNREAEVVKSTYKALTSQLFKNGSMSMDFKGIAEQAREYYNAIDSAGVATVAITNELKLQQVEYDQLYATAMNVSLSEVDRLEALNEASAVLERQITLKRQMAQFDKQAAKEGLEKGLVSSGINKYWLETQGQGMLKELLQFDPANGQYMFDTYFNSINTNNADTRGFFSGHSGVYDRYADMLSTQQGYNYVKGEAKRAGYEDVNEFLLHLKEEQNKATETINSTKYQLAQALHNLRGSTEGYESISKYILLVLNDLGLQQVDAEAKNTRAMIERLRKRITGKDGSTPNYPEGTIGYLEEELKKYNKELTSALDQVTRDELIGKINATEDAIAVMRGKKPLKEGTEPWIDAQINVLSEEISNLDLGVPETNPILQKMNDWEGSWEEFVNSLTEEERELFDQFAENMEKRWTLMNAKLGFETTKSVLQGNKTPKTESTKPEEPNYLVGSYGKKHQELEKQIEDAKKYLIETVGLSNEDIKAKLAELADLQQQLFQLEEQFGFRTTIEKTTNQWDEFNKAMANTSTIVNALTNTFKEGSEITVASVLQMVATCLPAIGSLINAISALTVTEAVEAGVGAVQKAVSTSKHWIEAIAAVASLGAVVAAAISAASTPNIQKFANGGIVGGSSFTGDRVVANVNSGEMILNRTQQANLFRMANGSGVQGNQVEFHISGTDLVGVLNNNNRKNRLVR